VVELRIAFSGYQRKPPEEQLLWGKAKVGFDTLNTLKYVPRFRNSTEVPVICLRIRLGIVGVLLVLFRRVWFLSTLIGSAAPILDDSVDKFHLRCSSLGNSKPGSEEPNDAPHGLRAQVSEEDIASAISG
jgi:hypothetical protein